MRRNDGLTTLQQRFGRAFVGRANEVTRTTHTRPTTPPHHISPVSSCQDLNNSVKQLSEAIARAEILPLQGTR